MRADRICGTSKSERETRILHRHLFLQHGIRCPLFLFPSSSGWHELAVACTSVQDLETKVLAFIDYYNRTMAKPFKWTYQGKALTM